MLDTNVLILRRWVNPAELPDEMAISAITLAELSAGPHEVRKPRGRIADLMIAATAIAEGLPLYTTNPADYAGLDTLIQVFPVTRPPVPGDRPPGR